ncbi:MAG: serine hydrolase [Candidatus Promineifilaceae bacterium]
MDGKKITRRQFLKGAAAVSGLALASSIGGTKLWRTPTASADDLDDFIMMKMQAAHLPGLAAGIVKNNQLVWSKGYGWANIENTVPATADTLFMLASTSKTATSVAVMQLVEDGLINLDTDVNDYLPFDVRVPQFPDSPITTRMLLTHSASIEDNWDVLLALYVQGDSPIALGTLLTEYFTPGGMYYHGLKNFYANEPGTVFHYCNVAVALAGYIAEVVSGHSFEDHTQMGIFGPLGMDETAWRLADLDINHIAMPYRHTGGGSYQPYGQYGYPDIPDGALRTSVNQLARFLIAFINNGTYNGITILDPQTVAEMKTEQIPAIHPGQCIIWYQEERNGDLLLGHNGGDDGVTTQMFFRLSDGVGTILLANGDAANQNEFEAFLAIQDRLYEEADTIEGNNSTIYMPAVLSS